MIVYANKVFLRLILEKTGSIFWRPRILCLGLGFALITAAVQSLQDHTDALYMHHHIGMISYGAIVNLAVVFRTSLSWRRYWATIGELHSMYNKWVDAYTQLYSCAKATADRLYESDPERSAGAIMRVKRRLTRMKCNFGLLSALAADRLIHGDTERVAQRSKDASWFEQIVLLRQELRVQDLTGAWNLPKFRIMESPLRDDIDEYVPIGRSADPVGEENNHYGNSWIGYRYALDAMPLRQETELLRLSSDRVGLVNSWILFDLASSAKLLNTPPPIQTRIYQGLSTGIKHFNQCMMFADVPFPLPFAQMMAITLIIFSFLFPVHMASLTTGRWEAPVLVGLTVSALWGLNSAAIELENPFGPDFNDIPLSDLHIQYMDTLREVGLADEALGSPVGRLDNMHMRPVSSQRSDRPLDDSTTCT